jgi:hypothetical protein
MPVTRIERRARALFGAVLRLYPASYRDEYGRAGLVQQARLRSLAGFLREEFDRDLPL